MQQTYNKVYYHAVPRGKLFHIIHMHIYLREHTEYVFTCVVIMQFIYIYLHYMSLYEQLEDAVTLNTRVLSTLILLIYTYMYLCWHQHTVN